MFWSIVCPLVHQFFFPTSRKETKKTSIQGCVIAEHGNPWSGAQVLLLGKQRIQLIFYTFRALGSLQFPQSTACNLSLHIRELKNQDDDRKRLTVYCTSATSKFHRRGVVYGAKQSRITSSSNPQASAGINPLFQAIFEVLCIFLSS